jgi:hypothetical protein
MYPPQLTGADSQVKTLLGYSTDYANHRVPTVERVMPVRGLASLTLHPPARFARVWEHRVLERWAYHLGDGSPQPSLFNSSRVEG